MGQCPPGPTERGSQGRNVTMQQTKLLLMMSWDKKKTTIEKKDKQRKKMEITASSHLLDMLAVDSEPYVLLSLFQCDTR